MTDNPLVSIVVPVYKVERFLDRCVESLVNQSYENIEIILVDDGSPDSCGAMCDAWAEKDSRIRVLHKENGGQATARNCAAKIARGEYFFFVDSDDYASPDAVEYLLDILRRSGAKMAGASFKIVYEEHERFENRGDEPLLTVDNIGACKAYYGEYYMQMAAPWGKLFPAELVRRFPFPAGHKHEDEAVVYLMYYYGESMVLSKRPIYAYYQNEGSVTHNRSRKNYEDTLSVLLAQVEFFEAQSQMELAAMAADRLCMSLVAQAAGGAEVYREYIAKNPSPGFLRHLPFKRRLLYRFYVLFGIDLNAIALKLKNKNTPL